MPGEAAVGDGTRESVMAKVFTVRIHKDLVALAKKVAVLRDQRVEDYATRLLASCADAAAEEIARRGSVVVHDRAEAVAARLRRDGFSTFITSEEVSTRLASLAGQCRTSVAGLIDQTLRCYLEHDFARTIRAMAIALDQKE